MKLNENETKSKIENPTFRDRNLAIKNHESKIVS